MAPSGLSGRLARLAARVDDLGIGHMARRVCKDSGGSVAASWTVPPPDRAATSTESALFLPLPATGYHSQLRPVVRR